MTLETDIEQPDEIGFDDDDPGSGARAFVDWIVVVAVALTVAFLVRGFVLAHFVVDGSSMDSTLTTGDRVFVNKLSYRLHDPNRGDVVVLHQINGAAERDLIKRVIALPGETIEMTNCEVRITEVDAPDADNDGQPDSRVLDEPYLDRDVISSTCGGDFEPVTRSGEPRVRDGRQPQRVAGQSGDRSDLGGRPRRSGLRGLLAALRLALAVAPTAQAPERPTSRAIASIIVSVWSL